MLTSHLKSWRNICTLSLLLSSARELNLWNEHNSMWTVHWDMMKAHLFVNQPHGISFQMLHCILGQLIFCHTQTCLSISWCNIYCALHYIRILIKTNSICLSLAAPLLHPPKKRCWSDVSQILSGQGMDPTSLLRRSERGVMAMQCNFHRLQFIVFTNNQ